MLPEEAEWFGRVMSDMSPALISPMLNVGSSTGDFRKIQQPWIEESIFEPLKRRGHHIVHLDLKNASGVDLVGDVSDPLVQEELRKMTFKSIFCSNILEHVTDRAELCKAILSLLPGGGYIFVSCPYAFPFHPDPIDNMFRPDVDNLADSFPGTNVILGEIVSSGTYSREVFQSPWTLIRKIAQLCLPFRARWKLAVNNLPWLFRRFEATCLVLHQDSAARSTTSE